MAGLQWGRSPFVGDDRVRSGMSPTVVFVDDFPDTAVPAPVVRGSRPVRKKCGRLWFALEADRHRLTRQTIQLEQACPTHSDRGIMHSFLPH